MVLETIRIDEKYLPYSTELGVNYELIKDQEPVSILQQTPTPLN